MRTAFLLILLLLCSPFIQPSFCAEKTWDPVKGPEGAWAHVIFASHDTMAAELKKAASGLPEPGRTAIQQLVEGLKTWLVQSPTPRLPADAIDTSRPFALVINNHMTGQAPAMIVPVKPDTEAIRKAGYIVVNGYIITSGNMLMARHITDMFKQGDQKVVPPPKGLLHVHMDVQAIHQAFQPYITLLTEQAFQAGKSHTAAAHKAKALLTLVVSMVRQVQSLSLGLEARDGNAYLAIAAEVQAGSALSDLCQSQRNDARPAHPLPPAGLLCINGSVKGIGPILFTLFEALMLSSVQLEQEKVIPCRQAGVKLAGQSGPDMAIREQIYHRGLTIEMILGFSGGMDDVRNLINQMSTPPMSEHLFPAGTYRLQSITQDARKSQGAAIDQIKINVQTAHLSDAEKKQAVKYWPNKTITLEHCISQGRWIGIMSGGDVAEPMNARLKAMASGGDKASAMAAPLEISLDPARLMSADASEPVNMRFTFTEDSLNAQTGLPLDALIALLKQLGN